MEQQHVRYGDNSWVINLKAPTPAQMTEWAIALNPKLASTNPAEAINRVIDLYITGGGANMNWARVTRDRFVKWTEEIEDDLLCAHINPAKNSMGKWLAEKAPTARDQIKSGRALLDAIGEMVTVGVATGVREMNGKHVWDIERLDISLPCRLPHEKIPSQWHLSKREAQEFLRLRELKHSRWDLQRKWQRDMGRDELSNKIVGNKRFPTVKKRSNSKDAVLKTVS